MNLVCILFLATFLAPSTANISLEDDAKEGVNK